MKVKFWIAALLITLLAMPFCAMAAPVGKITKLEGNVDITSPGAKARNAVLNDSLDEKDFVRTKSKSKAEITFHDGNILRLAENSRVGITEYGAGKNQESSIIHLFRGKIYSIFRTIRGSRYEVHTTTCVTGVRGTQFYNYYLEGVSGTIFEKGSGYVYNKNYPKDTIIVKPGQGAFITAANIAPVLREVSTGEMTDLQNSTQMKEQADQAGSQEQPKPEEQLQATAAPAGAQDQAKPEEQTKPGLLTSVTELNTNLADVSLTDPSLLPPPEPPPVSEIKPVPPPPPINSTPAINMEIGALSVGFPHTITGGAITGTEAIQTDGVYFNVNTSGTYTGDPASPAGSMISGVVEAGNAVNAGVAGYMMSLPFQNGSLLSLTASVYVNAGQQAGFITGPAVGTLSGGSFTGNGNFFQTVPFAKTTVSPDSLILTPWNNFYPPICAGITFNADGSVDVDNAGASYQSEIRGIDANRLDNGRLIKIGVGGAVSTGGHFSNPGAISEFSNMKAYSYESADKTAFFTDNLAGQINATQQTVSMSGTFEYMNTLYAGKLTANHLGSYDNAYNYSGILTYTAGLMPLTLVNELGAMPGISGLMGSTESIWSNSSIPLTYMGVYAPSHEASGIWESYNYAAGGNVTNDAGGAYKGYHLTQKIFNMVSIDHMGLYVDAGGNAGILHGNSQTEAGQYDSSSGSFVARGASNRTELAVATGINAANLVSAGTSYRTYTLQEELSMPTGGIFEHLSIKGIKSFAIGKIDLTGEYVGDPRGDVFAGFDLRVGVADVGSKRIVFTELGSDYTPDLGGSFFGNVAGAMADWQSAFTAVSGGHVKGTYNPLAAGTWSGTMLASFVETSTFMNMAETDAGRAKLAELNIPYARVGTVSLSGSDANASIAINDTGFYAYSTGAKPQIWASSNVTGNYLTTPGPGVMTHLTGAGGSFQADFILRSWGGNGNPWGASIANGSGGYNGSTVFKGSATGMINGTAITGTASGTAR